jgi:hypothetical protein
MEQGQKSANLLATSSLPLNIVMGVSLKYLWGMVNTLQFVIFMDQWKLNWPPNASMAIKSIRSIALGEFIDTKALKAKILDYYGLNSIPQKND